MKLECIHIDTCLPDYWSGHHLTHIQIPVYKGMSLKEIKESLKDEIRIYGGGLGGNTRLNYLLGDYVDPEDEKESYKAIKAVYAAINRIKPTKKGQRKFFRDLDDQCEYDDNTVYAFFILREI